MRVSAVNARTIGRINGDEENKDSDDDDDDDDRTMRGIQGAHPLASGFLASSANEKKRYFSRVIDLVDLERATCGGGEGESDAGRIQGKFERGARHGRPLMRSTIHLSRVRSRARARARIHRFGWCMDQS